MSKAIRVILTLALIYGAYTETGIFTALSLLLIYIAIESQGWITKRAVGKLLLKGKDYVSKYKYW